MKNTDRIERLEQLRAELAALITDEEQELYPALVHLDDLLEDLQLQEAP